jgi:hypothetical protein
MAIQESRRSIKEAVSVKRLTQLAFVFIPLSYASSLFGMNINEMTGNGSSLWIFVVTSLALLISAMCFWGLSSTIQRRWARHMEERHPGNISFKEYITILYASIRTGNFKWMIREGILLGLMTNNAFGDEQYTHRKAYNKFYGDWIARRKEMKKKSSV